MSERRRNPPCQKALALRDWPKADRETWQAAQAAAGVLDDDGVASHLSARTREDLTSRYAYFLSFLAHRGKLEHYGPGAASVTQENILEYVRYLEPRVSSVTLAQSLYKILRVASCLAPPAGLALAPARRTAARPASQAARQAQRGRRDQGTFPAWAAIDGEG